VNNFFFRTGFIILLISACIYIALSQNQGIAYQELLTQYSNAQGYYDKATALSRNENYGAKEEALEEELNKKALEGFTQLYKAIPAPLHDSLRFHTSFKIGELQHYFENFSEAVFYYKQAITTKEKTSLTDSLLFKPYLYGGIIFYNQNKFDTAIRFFKKAESIQAAYNNKLSEGERLYNILGVLYYERGDYKQGKNYFQKALALLPASNPYYNELFVNYNINLAQLHLRLEEYDKANEIYHQLLPLKINLNEINHNIGSLNLSLGAAAKALEYFRKVNYQNNKIVRLYNSMGEAFFNINLFDSAIHYYQKAINAYQSLGGNADPVGYGLVQKNLGQYTAHFQKNEEAIQYYQQAIHQFYPAFAGNDVRSNPESFSGVFSYINLFNTLNAKAEAWHNIYFETKNISAAKEELKTYQSAFKLIEYVEQTYDSDEARLFLTKIKHAAHGKPIDIAFELFNKTKDKSYLETLYYFDQQNKAAILSLNRQLSTSLSETGSPLLQKEQEIKTEITRLSIRSAQVTDSAQLVIINNSIRDAEIELGKTREQLYPNSALKKGNIPSITSLQNSLLDEETALISYHLSEEKITTLVITKSKLACYQQALPNDFTENIQQQITAIKSGSVKTKDSATNYYHLLLSNVSLPEFNQLIIIPDDVLAYFPFESLQDKNNNFLVEKVAVQYQFSTALLGLNETDFSHAETLSFAPFAQQSFGDSLPRLPASIQEVELAKGQHFLDTAATKNKFLQHSSAFKIMHLATHAVADNGKENLSYIAFSPTNDGQDHLLYTQEIYNLRLQNTGLVILSACETGAGQLVKGEGILSLSRAFSYAGCPNIITSLWKADDFSTANLTSRIHNYLDEGYSISKAVQQSKIDYLHDKKINPRLKHPYYWSHLVFIGNYTPEKKINSTPFIIAGVVGLLLFLLLIKKPGKTRR
jgi:CHAT domain-containing protein/Flp pilus assembly protein TadD